MTFNEACRAIVANRGAKALNYAIGYAEYGMSLTSGTHEAKVQALYIMGNITHWRGDLAKEVRAAIKKEAGVN